MSGRMYQVHEFAELAGVTVKALHHYDRLGLLKPRRTQSGYRLYTERNLERLEQIVALKFLGLPLKQIKVVLDRAALALPDALRLQRRVLERKQQVLGRAIHAIQEGERAIESGEPADPAILRKIIEVLDMQESIDEMKRYYSAEAWTKRRQHYEQWPSREWRDLYRDVEAAFGEDPPGERAQSLATRWMRLIEAEAGGDSKIRFGMYLAWRDRDYWPPLLRKRSSEFQLDDIWKFIRRAIIAYRKNYCTDEEWAGFVGITREPNEPGSIEWYELFLEVSAALEEDSADKRAQALVSRWLRADQNRGQALLARWRELAAESTIGDGPMLGQMALFNLEMIWAFLARASYYRMRNYDSLYREAEAALGKDPGGERAQAVAARWAELSRGVHLDVRADFRNAYPMLQHHVAFEEVAKFVEEAVAGRGV